MNKIKSHRYNFHIVFHMFFSVISSFLIMKLSSDVCTHVKPLLHKWDSAIKVSLDSQIRQIGNKQKRNLSDLHETHWRLQKRIRRQTGAGVCLKRERGKVVLMVLNFALLWSSEKPYLERIPEVVWVRSGLVKAFKGALPFSGSTAFKVCPDGN